MIRLPERPSRQKAISMPRARNEVYDRRKRPASARGVRGRSGRRIKVSWRCKFLGGQQEVGGGSGPFIPVDHDVARAGAHRILDNAFNDGSAIGSIGARDRAGGCCFAGGCPEREIWRARKGRARTTERRVSPCASMSSKAPKIPGRARSNSAQSPDSGRRCASPIGGRVKMIARSARSGRPITSSMPLKSRGARCLK
jgi:hypothetical protein